MKSLPPEPFVIAEWKEVKVNPDCIIQFNKKSNSAPYAYVGKRLWARATDKLLSLYDDHQLIKQHVITSNHRHTDMNDFPPNVQSRYIGIDEGLPDYLQSQALKIGKNFHALIRKTLKPNAFMNMRKAQGLVALKNLYPPELIEEASSIAVEHSSMYPKLFVSMIQKLIEEKMPPMTPIALSDESAGFVRDLSYFNHMDHHQKLLF